MSRLLRDQALRIFHAAIAAAHPATVMRWVVRLTGGHLEIGDRSYDLDTINRVRVLGAGKASAAMAKSLEEILSDHISGGVVITKYGHAVPCPRITIREAGHPVVDESGLTATREILDLAAALDAGDLALVLISGGGSALLELLPASIPLADAQQTVDQLLRCGATIAEMNAVRKHISQVKGGQLARILAPCPSVTLLISDVIGDRLDVIASGPTVADPTTFAEAWNVITRFGLAETVPETIANQLRAGMNGALPETPKAGDPAFVAAHHQIVASNAQSLSAAKRCAEELGFEAEIMTVELRGEAGRAAERVTQMLRHRVARADSGHHPLCLLFGGETTVTVHGNGKGGRCQEFALAALEAMTGFAGDFLIAACGTDGTDGPTDAAGGIASPEVCASGRALGLSAADYLSRNDSYNFLKQTDGLIVTGPTGTNVMDVYLAMVP